MKKILAVLLAAMMVLGAAMTVCAADSKTSPSGGDYSSPMKGRTDGGSVSFGSGSGSGVITTGTDGNWIMNSITDWNYRLNDGSLLRNRWAYVYNPYANSTDWFYFDANGTMLYGWQWIKDADGVTRLYHLYTVHDGNFGKCQLGGTVEGQTLNASGAVTVNGVVQTR